MKKKDRAEYKDFLDSLDTNVNDEVAAQDIFEQLDPEPPDYDAEAVEACPHCNSLYLVDFDAPECLSCGNELKEVDIVVYETIHDYLEGREIHDESSKD